jgi:hypothetical protein
MGVDVSTLDQDDLDYLAATYARLDATPSLDELLVAAAVGPYQGSLAIGTSTYFFVAPYPLRVVGGWFYLYNTIAASDTDYLSLSLGKRTTADASFSTIVSGDTKLTGPTAWGTNLVYGHSYSWNAFAWDENAALLDPGDVVAFGVAGTGNPTAPKGQVAVTLRTVPA